MRRLQMIFYNALPHAATTCHTHIASSPPLSPAPHRTVLALLTHTAPQQYFHFAVKRFTVIRGFGRGNLSRSFLKFSQLMLPLFPRRSSHLKKRISSYLISSQEDRSSNPPSVRRGERRSTPSLPPSALPAICLPISWSAARLSHHIQLQGDGQAPDHGRVPGTFNNRIH